MKKKPLVSLEVLPGLSVNVGDEFALALVSKLLESLEGNRGIDHEARRKGDQTPAQGERSSDTGNAELKPDDPRRCAYPAARYGWDGDPVNPKPTDRAVCSICCPYNLTCPVKHRTFDDINNPRDSRTPPVEGKGDHPEN